MVGRTNSLTGTRVENAIDTSPLTKYSKTTGGIYSNYNISQTLNVTKGKIYSFMISSDAVRYIENGTVTQVNGGTILKNVSNSTQLIDNVCLVLTNSSQLSITYLAKNNSNTPNHPVYLIKL